MTVLNPGFVLPTGFLLFALPLFSTYPDATAFLTGLLPLACHATAVIYALFLHARNTGYDSWLLALPMDREKSIRGRYLAGLAFLIAPIVLALLCDLAGIREASLLARKITWLEPFKGIHRLELLALIFFAAALYNFSLLALRSHIANPAQKSKGFGLAYSATVGGVFAAGIIFSPATWISSGLLAALSFAFLPAILRFDYDRTAPLRPVDRMKSMIIGAVLILAAWTIPIVIQFFPFNPWLLALILIPLGFGAVYRRGVDFAVCGTCRKRISNDAVSCPKCGVSTAFNLQPLKFGNARISALVLAVLVPYFFLQENISRDTTLELRGDMTPITIEGRRFDQFPVTVDKKYRYGRATAEAGRVLDNWRIDERRIIFAVNDTRLHSFKSELLRLYARRDFDSTSLFPADGSIDAPLGLIFLSNFRGYIDVGDTPRLSISKEWTDDLLFRSAVAMMRRESHEARMRFIKSGVDDKLTWAALAIETDYVRARAARADLPFNYFPDRHDISVFPETVAVRAIIRKASGLFHFMFSPEYEPHIHNPHLKARVQKWILDNMEERDYVISDIPLVVDPRDPNDQFFLREAARRPIAEKRLDFLALVDDSAMLHRALQVSPSAHTVRQALRIHSPESVLEAARSREEAEIFAAIPLEEAFRIGSEKPRWISALFTEGRIDHFERWKNYYESLSREDRILALKFAAARDTPIGRAHVAWVLSRANDFDALPILRRYAYPL